MKAKVILVLFLAAMCLLSCKKEAQNHQTNPTQKSFSGFVQKGPFIVGTSIQVIGLNTDLSQTGLIYTTQISNNRGLFQTGNVNFSSPYVCLRADGFYFNEVSGLPSNSQITLYALADTSSTASLNVNVITNLARGRIEYLKSHGMSFYNAKRQAEREVLRVFSITKNDFQAAERLDISNYSEDNGILLAISAVLQGFRSESELIELMTNISTDIKYDGVLNDTLLGSKLISHAIFMDTIKIKANLISRYNSIGISPNLPPFGKYLRRFMDSTAYHVNGTIMTYPALGAYGPNILDLSRTVSTNGGVCSLAASFPKGSGLKIVIRSLTSSNWYYTPSTSQNWAVDIITNYRQTFTGIEAGRLCDLSIYFQTGTYVIEYYERGGNVPSRTKTLIVS